MWHTWVIIEAFGTIRKLGKVSITEQVVTTVIPYVVPEGTTAQPGTTPRRSAWWHCMIQVSSVLRFCSMLSLLFQTHTLTWISWVKYEGHCAIQTLEIYYSLSYGSHWCRTVNQCWNMACCDAVADAAALAVVVCRCRCFCCCHCCHDLV